MNELISVIIPVYNVEKYLIDCLNSVCCQTYRNLEIILINDGSTDNSKRICQEYQKKDKRILFLEQENRGLSCARNKGLMYAKGNYVYFLDSDDYIENNLIQEVMKYISDNDLDLCFFSAQTRLDYDKFKTKKDFYNRKQYYDINCGKAVYKEMNKYHEYSASSCLYIASKELIDKNNLKFYPGIYHEDELYTYRLIYNALKVGVINHCYYVRRIREGSIMTSSAVFVKQKRILSYFILIDFFKKEYSIETDKQIKKCLKKHIISAVCSINALLYTNSDAGVAKKLDTVLRKNLYFKSVKIILSYYFKTLYEILKKIKTSIN